MCVTLKTQYGVTWKIVRLAGKTAFIHNQLVVVRLPDGRHHFIIRGKSVASFQGAGECLDVASEMILEAYANGIMPTWECTDEDDEQEPITERYPSNYVPDWAEAAA